MIFRFGKFHLDPVRETLTGPDGIVALRGHALLVLKVLVERSPEVVSKDEILDAVWGHDALSENSIAQVIKDIRLALGDNAKNPEYVVTRYGRGYQCIARVELIDPDFRGEESQAHKKKPRWPWLLALAPLVIALVWLAMARQPGPIPADLETVYLKPVSGQDAELLSESFAEYLAFALGSSSGTKRFAIADGNTPSDARVINVGLAATDGNDGSLAVFIDGEMVSEKQSWQVFNETSELLEVSFDQILSTLEVEEEIKLEAGLVSRSDYATRTLLRGMAAIHAGETQRAVTLLEACLADDPDFDFARYELAIAFRRNGEYESALANLAVIEWRSALPFWAYRIYNTKGITLWRMGRSEEAISAYEIALEAASDDAHKATVLTNLGILNRDIGSLEQAETYTTRAVELADRADDPRTMGSARNTLASIYMRTGRLEEALPPLEVAREIFYETGNRAFHAAVVSRTAKIHERLGNRSMAIQLNRLVLGAREQLGDELGVSSTLYRLADLELAEGRFAQSREFAQRGLNIATDLEDTQMMMDGNFALGEVALAERRYNDAQLYAREAQRLASLRAYPASELDAAVMKLRISLESGQGDAIDQEQIESLRVRSDAEGGRTKLLNLGMFEARLHALRNEDFEARNVLERVLESASELNERKYQARALVGLAKLALERNELAQAANNIREAAEFNPPDYPYFLLQARLQAAQGRTEDALALAYEAREKSGGWWQAEDQEFLDALSSQAGYSSESGRVPGPD